MAYYGREYDEPSYTCPVIDNSKKEVISLMEFIFSKLEDLNCEDSEDFLNQLEDIRVDIEQEFEDFQDKLEDVRKSNIDLRDWGKIWKEKAESLETEILNKEDEINDLNNQINDLSNQLKELEKQAVLN
jgi:chromosome segregation ATPase